MAIICPACQTSNEDGHRFCSNCGSSIAQPVVPASPTVPPGPPAIPPAPLAVPPTPAAPPPAPAMQPAPATPPPAPPGQWTGSVPTPVSSGAARTSPVRLPAGILIGGVIAALVLVGAVGIALGVLLKPSGPGTVVVPSGGPIVTPKPVVTPGPVESRAPVVSQAPSATPAPVVTPVPVVSQAPVVTPAPSGGTAGTQTVDVANISVTVPGDWDVLTKEDTLIQVARANGGVLTLLSGNVDATETADSWIQGIYDSVKQSSPDVTVCRAASDVQVPSGPVGRTEILCYTAKTQSGETFSDIKYIVVGADASHHLYDLEISAQDSIYDASINDFFANALPSVVWKLYQGH